MVVWFLLFRLTPRKLHIVRVSLLRMFGARIGDRFQIHPSARVFLPWMLTVGDDVTVGDKVELYCLGPMEIGDRTIISQHSHLCGGTHDLESPQFDLVRSEIKIANDVWVCADAFIGPGVTIGAGAVIGARAAVFKDCVAMGIYGGNPARLLRMRTKSDESVS